MEPDGWKGVCSYTSYVTLGDGGLITCPTGDGPPYQYITVTINDFNGDPIPGFSANLIDFTVHSTNDTQWYGNLSCTFTAVDPESNSQGEIRFEVVGDVSIIGNISIRTYVDEYFLPDIETLPCKSIDITVDGRIDLADFTIFGNAWGGYDWRCDFDFDGDIDLVDFTLFANHWNHTG